MDKKEMGTRMTRIERMNADFFSLCALCPCLPAGRFVGEIHRGEQESAEVSQRDLNGF